VIANYLSLSLSTCQNSSIVVLDRSIARKHALLLKDIAQTKDLVEIHS
jgi:hypothetical protein